MRSNFKKIILVVSVVLLTACSSTKLNEVESPSEALTTSTSSQASAISTETPSKSKEQDIPNTPNAEDGYEVYLGLRNLIITSDPSETSIEQGAEFPNVWGILLEFWSGNNTITLVSIADGTTSLYFSNGGGIIGAGEYEAVTAATFEYISLAESYVDKMAVTTEYALPVQGKMAFHVLTFDGSFTMSIDENELTSGNHKFSPLFLAANDVISQIRIHTPQE